MGVALAAPSCLPGVLTACSASRPAGQRVLLAAGGRGGRGNLAFKTARNTAPALAELGERGQGERARSAALRPNSSAMH